MLEQIRQLKGSSGELGWPVAVKDRVAYAVCKDNELDASNVAVAFLWTMRDAVVPKLEKKNLAIAANFYTPSGLAGMVRNILANPHIRYLVMFGEEYSAKEGDSTKAGLTSAGAVRAFFSKGVGGDRKLEGFETAVHFDKNIPTELIQKTSQSVELIDLNKEMPNSALEEKIARANQLLKTLPAKPPFLENPQCFGYEKVVESFPFEGGPLLVRGNTIPETWIEIMHYIYRYGRKNLMDAGTDRWVKEINNLVAVIHNPQSMDLSTNPFLVPLTREKIESYKKEILSPALPEGKAYTYGNKLRAYFVPSGEYVKNLANFEGFKDFEFGKGPHTEANVTYLENGCEINQIKDIVDAMKRNIYSKSLVAVTWHAADELMRKHKSSPCLVMLQPVLQDEKLNLTVYFRSHDMAQGWPENAYGCAAIQKEVADGVGVQTGILTIISSSAQIYNHYYAQIEEVLKKYRKPRLCFDDAKGNYVVGVKDGKIVVRHLHPQSGIELEQFVGKTAKELYLQIASKNFIAQEHAMYLGAELAFAQSALELSQKYEQDKRTSN